MKGCKLVEYRPGRYIWVDQDGQTVRKATDEEADAHLWQLLDKPGKDIIPDSVQPEPGAGALPAKMAAPAAVADIDTGNGAGFFLWVDPRREAGYDPKTFDLTAFLRRAVALFQTKERWKGQSPTVILANPAHQDGSACSATSARACRRTSAGGTLQTENGLTQAAQALNLVVIGDPLVTAGTYRLGLLHSAEVGDE